MKEDGYIINQGESGSIRIYRTGGPHSGKRRNYRSEPKAIAHYKRGSRFKSKEEKDKYDNEKKKNIQKKRWENIF